MKLGDVLEYEGYNIFILNSSKSLSNSFRTIEVNYLHGASRRKYGTFASWAVHDYFRI